MLYLFISKLECYINLEYYILGHVIDDTWRLGYALHSYQFFHVRMEGNKLAHELAKRAVLFADTDIWVEDLLNDLDTMF